MKSARQEIMDKLKKAVHKMPEKPDFETPVYHPINEPLELVFKENLEKVNGSVHLFKSETELHAELKKFLSQFKSNTICCRENEIQDQLKQADVMYSECATLPESIEVGITGCEYLIAQTGSVMVSSSQKGGRQLFVYPPIHVIVAAQMQVVKYLGHAYNAIQKKYAENLPSQITIITGPSRTADIEKTLVMGAHGPKELHVFLY